MAHGAYAKRRVAGRSSLGGGYGARSSRGLGVRAKEWDRKAVRNQIRSIERLLKKTLPLEIKTAHEKRLEDLKRQAELHAHRKLALRDRKLKFYERRKVERRIRRLEKQYRCTFDQPHVINVHRRANEILEQLSKLKEDLEYVRFFPKSERYISLFTGSDDEMTRSRRIELREKIKARRTAAAAAGTDLDETGSEDDEPMDLSEDDIYIEGSSSDDADADDEWTDKSPRRGDDRDDETSRETMPIQQDLSAPQQRARRESVARVLMPPPRAMNRPSSSIGLQSRNRLSSNYLSSSNSEGAYRRRNYSSSGLSCEVCKDEDTVIGTSSSESSFSNTEGRLFWGLIKTMVQLNNVLEIVKKTTGGLVWKQWKMTRSRKNNRRKRLFRIQQNEAVIKACKAPPPEHLGIPPPTATTAEATPPS